jgi:hypothetical protein
MNHQQVNRPTHWADLPHNGKTWQDMPGYDPITKRLNFALYRRGLLENHEEEEDGSLVYHKHRATGNNSYAHKMRKIREQEEWRQDTSWSSCGGGGNEPHEERLKRCWDLYEQMRTSPLMPKGWTVLMNEAGVSKWVRSLLKNKERCISPIMLDKVEQFAKKYLDGVDRSHQPKWRKKEVAEAERAAWQERLRAKYLAMEANPNMPNGWKMRLQEMGFYTATQRGFRLGERRFGVKNLELIERVLTTIEQQAKQTTTA